jgi:hypothetical protein
VSRSTDKHPDKACPRGRSRCGVCSLAGPSRKQRRHALAESPPAAELAAEADDARRDEQYAREMDMVDEVELAAEMAELLREGRANMPPQSFEDAVAQIERSLAGVTVDPRKR